MKRPRFRRAIIAALLCICCLPVVSGNVAEAEVLFSDRHGVQVVYDVVDTGKRVFCEGPPERDTNYTDKKIKIWKVTLKITNGSGRKIKPQGPSIAHIDVEPDQGSVLDYCYYRRVGNLYKVDGQSDQRKFMFGIASGVYFIGAGKTFSNSTYLYLYEDQKPRLIRWHFDGYQFLKDDAKVKKSQSKHPKQPATQATPRRNPRGQTLGNRRPAPPAVPQAA